MSIRKVALALAAVGAMLLVVPVAAGAKTSALKVTSFQKPIAITGTAPGNKKFTGQFQINRFVTRHHQTFAVGHLTGTLDGQNVDKSGVAIPVHAFKSRAATRQAAGGSCTILDLTLGPVHLNLLGLVVDLNQVHLTITAQQGPGNLLGNLLCSVANLLNPPATGGGLAGFLNSLSAFLSSLAAAL